MPAAGRWAVARRRAVAAMRRGRRGPGLALLSLACALPVAWPRAAAAQRGVQLTPDQDQILVNKDVGDQRWAIAFNLDDDTVTGNVYFPSGGDPIFLWCEYLSDNGAADQVDLVIDFRCFAADACFTGTDPSASWSFLSDVTVPATFFLPPGTARSAARLGLLERPPERVRSRRRGPSIDLGRSRRLPATGAAAVRLGAPAGVRAVGRGSQLTPDEKRFLVSKNVGEERWAIALNEGAGTVTGNVFSAGGFGAPTFLWCDPVGDDGDPNFATREIRLTCFAAAPCPSIPCTPDQWSLVANVVATGAFFLPTQCTGTAPPPVPPPFPLSAAQRAFVAARGLPEQFSVMLATETVDAEGRSVPLETPRRIESWVYNRGQLVAAVFDNGFFVREDVLGPAAPLARTSLNPGAFHAGMTRSEAEAVLGPPSCVETATVGGASVEVLRFRASGSEPVRSATFADGELTSVVAGFAVRTDGSSRTDPCS